MPGLRLRGVLGRSFCALLFAVGYPEALHTLTEVHKEFMDPFLYSPGSSSTPALLVEESLRSLRALLLLQCCRSWA